MPRLADYSEAGKWNILSPSPIQRTALGHLSFEPQDTQSPFLKSSQSLLSDAIKAAIEDESGKEDECQNKDAFRKTIEAFRDVIQGIAKQSSDPEEQAYWMALASGETQAPLPLTWSSQEDEIYLLTQHIGVPSKALAYPCCPSESVYSYKGLSGKCAMRCPNCGNFVIVDFDKQTIEPVRRLRLHDNP